MNRIAIIAKNALCGHLGDGLPRIVNQNICFRNCNNSFVQAQFPEAKTLFFNGCDKNFVYYNLHPPLFPKLEQIYLDSHPAECPVLHRFFSDHRDVDIYLLDRLWKLERHWFEGASYIHPISIQHYNEKLLSYRQEEIKLE